MAVAVTHEGVLGAWDDEFEFALDFILDVRLPIMSSAQVMALQG